MLLLHFEIDVIGEIDFVKSLLSIRASIVNSQALGIFRATGDVALVVCWGSPPYQVLSIGGFYPGGSHSVMFTFSSPRKPPVADRPPNFGACE